MADRTGGRAWLWIAGHFTALGLLALVAGFMARPAAAEFSLSGYLGEQMAHDSNVRGTDPTGVGAFDFTAAWDGRSFDNPLHYGVRGTYWQSARFGWTVDFDHQKVYGDDATLAVSGFPELEFTDGLNALTVGPIWRFDVPNAPRLKPYAGISGGLSLPYVEVQTTAAGTATDGLQIGGPAVAWNAGVSYDIDDRWAVFGEYKGTHHWIDVDLDGGGALETQITTHAINFGVTYTWR